MEIRAHLKDALYNLASYKMRSALAVVGILVGTASVVAMVLCAQLATEKALAQFKPLGTNLMAVTMWTRGESSDSAIELSIDDALAMPKLHDDIKTVAAYTDIYKRVYHHENEIKGSVIGTNAALKDILNLPLSQGRFISDLDQYAHFVVIGDGIYQQLRTHGQFEVLGRQIRFNKEYYTIIGVLAPTPSQSYFFHHDINSSFFMPLTTVLMSNNQEKINNVIFNLKENADFKRLEELIQAYLQQFSTNMEIYIRSAEEIVEQMKSQSRIFTLLLGLIGSISLLVGGIGVMNIMLVSVTERRKEIGIRKAVGARLHDIYGLFLTESMIISFLGGIIGVLLGLLISFFIANYAGWPFAIKAMPPLVGFVVSVSVGVFFGFYPAYKAAHLPPIEALRT